MSAPVLSTAHALVTALREEGVELVFGIPGTHNLSLYPQLEANGIRHVTPRHEQGAAYAADGYARACGRPGVCFVTTGPALLNAAAGAATAYADSIPMLIVSPGMATDVDGRDTGFLHETKDQRGAMDRIVLRSTRVLSAAAAFEAVTEAFRLFDAGRPRPIHIEIPLDVMDAPGPVPTATRTRAKGPAPDSAALERAAELISQAISPALILGGGARRAGKEATELAERLGAAVVTTVNGKGVVDERHPLSLGASIRLSTAKRFLEERDLLVVVGSELGESDLWGPPLRPRGRVVRVDLDSHQFCKNTACDVGLAGDAPDVLERLLERVPGGRSALAELPEIREQIIDEALQDGREWQPLMERLRDRLADDALVCGDSTMLVYYGAVHFLPCPAAGLFLYPTGYATLGYALPAAMGAKLACPARQVVALMGDGGLMFSVAELVTAAQEELGIPIVVANNGGYGEIRRQQLELGQTPIGVDLVAPDIPALAEAMGCIGVRVNSPDALVASVGRAFSEPRPTVIEWPC